MHDLTLNRIYFSGWKPEEDFKLLRKDVLIVQPVRPPKNTGTVVLANQTVDFPGDAALLYRVIATGALTRHEDLLVTVGDVVQLRNAHLDPIHPNMEALAIDVKHVLAIVERGA